MAVGVPKAELTGIYGAMVKRMSRKLGDVAEAVEVAWHKRERLNFSFSIGVRHRSGTSVTRT